MPNDIRIGNRILTYGNGNYTDKKPVKPYTNLQLLKIKIMNFFTSEKSGVYIVCLVGKDKQLYYYVGQTRRNIKTRTKEHLKRTIKSDSNYWNILVNTQYPNTDIATLVNEGKFDFKAVWNFPTQVTKNIKHSSFGDIVSEYAKTYIRESIEYKLAEYLDTIPHITLIHMPSKPDVTCVKEFPSSLKDEVNLLKVDEVLVAYLDSTIEKEYNNILMSGLQ